MIRVSIVLLLLFIAIGHAQPPEEPVPPVFDPQQTRDVYVEALSFMAPRILDPVPVSQLTIWGLRGLTALDPRLTVSLRDKKLLLSSQANVLFELAEPGEDTPAVWADAAVKMAGAGVAASELVRRAGTQGIIQSFFDELFNHLDPYSRYVAPSDAGLDRARRVGRAGLGLTLTRQRGPQIRVKDVVTGSPAALAGIRAGDAIVAVDGQPTGGQDPETVEALIAGPEGTTLNVTWRGRDGRLRTAPLARELVPPETVYAERFKDVLLIRITGFAETTALHLMQTLRDGMTGPRLPDGVVIDLRGNRGGLVRQAVEAADAFLPAGIVAVAAGRDPQSNHTWRSGRSELAEGMPVVVLVDGGTASAAEILAAALADRGRAVIVGSTTLGKGLVQTIDPLPDGGELFVTWSRVLAPRGWPIQGLGLMPQVCTSRGHDVLRRQMAALANGEQLMAEAIAVHRAARAPLQPAQAVAVRNICPASEGREIDLETARALVDNPAAYAAALLPPIRQQSQAGR